MRRREIIAALGVAAWPLAARAQQPTLPVIGFLHSASPAGYAEFVTAFEQGLAEVGFVEGRNVATEYRWADGAYDRLPALAAELARLQPTVIFANNPGALHVKAATTTIPIVFTAGFDPIELGLVTNLKQPGGNITGVSILNVELEPKRLEFLHELGGWLAGLKFEQAVHHIVLEDCIAAVEAATARRDRLEAHIKAALPEWSLAPVVQALQALRGMALVAAATLVAELGDITRFANPRQLMAYLGLVPSEHSSGGTRRQGRITKAGNGAARRMLIEAAGATGSRHGSAESFCCDRRVWPARFATRRGRRRNDCVGDIASSPGRESRRQWSLPQSRVS